MSKNKPSTTIEYVIRLQDKERQLLDDAIGAYQINRIATPIVSLMSDVSGMAVLLSLLASVIGFTFLVSEDLDTAGLIDAFTTQRDQAIAAGVIVGSPLGPGLGGLLSKWLGLFPEK